MTKASRKRIFMKFNKLLGRIVRKKEEILND